MTGHDPGFGEGSDQMKGREVGLVPPDMPLSRKFFLTYCKYRTSFILIFCVCAQPANIRRDERSLEEV